MDKFFTINSPHADGTQLAIRQEDGDPARPVFVWLGGFRSDMMGTKAEAMVAQAAQLGCGSIRFDYSGHGESGGRFEAGTISHWVADSLAVLRHCAPEQVILVGSSMGGWIALRLVQELRRQAKGPEVSALLLVAPAPDFTKRLMQPAFSQDDHASMAQRGFVEQPSDYSDEPTIITRALIEDGTKNCVLDGDLEVGCPVRILQGMQDPDVPYTHALDLVNALVHDDVVITMVRDGDHRLSRDEDIERLTRMMGEVAAFV